MGGLPPCSVATGPTPWLELGAAVHRQPVGGDSGCAAHGELISIPVCTSSHPAMSPRVTRRPPDTRNSWPRIPSDKSNVANVPRSIDGERGEAPRQHASRRCEQVRLFCSSCTHLLLISCMRRPIPMQLCWSVKNSGVPGTLKLDQLVAPVPADRTLPPRWDCQAGGRRHG